MSLRNGLPVVLGLLIAACEPDSSKFTVEYYKANAEQRKAKLKECMNDPGALRNDPLCVNAGEADFDDAIGRWEDLPPMNLPKSLPRKGQDKED